MKEWAEIADQLEAIDPISAGFFRNTKGFFTSGKLLIRTPDDFTRQMLQAKIAFDNLKQTVASIFGQEYRDDQIVFEVLPPDEAPSPLDEIIEEWEKDSIPPTE